MLVYHLMTNIQDDGRKRDRELAYYSISYVRIDISRHYLTFLKKSNKL